MQKSPTPRLVADTDARTDRTRDIFLRLRDVAADPDGEHLWLLLDPKDEDCGTIQ